TNTRIAASASIAASSLLHNAINKEKIKSWETPAEHYRQIEEFEYTGERLVPKDVTRQGWHNNAFIGCKRSKVVVLNEGLQDIGRRSFYNYIAHRSSLVTSLESIKLPSTVILSVIEVGNYSFWGCKNLKEVVLNEGIQKIGGEAFSYSSLENITLPYVSRRV
ncbi:hypothetical protein ACHAXR_001648, partial [Thalassiosira sp. AJA248-18]